MLSEPPKAAPQIAANCTSFERNITFDFWSHLQPSIKSMCHNMGAVSGFCAGPIMQFLKTIE